MGDGYMTIRKIIIVRNLILAYDVIIPGKVADFICKRAVPAISSTLVKTSMAKNERYDDWSPWSKSLYK